MTFQPILSKQAPSGAAGSGEEREVYSSNLFNNTTGAHTSSGATYPITMSEDPTTREFYYFGGAQVGTGAGPVFIVQPYSRSTAVGTTEFGFSCQATDPTSNETIYSWYVTMSGAYVPTKYTTGVTRTPGTNVSNCAVIVPTTAAYNGSSWYVIASNPSGSTQSNTAVLTITGITTKPVITADGYAASENAPEGGTYLFTTNAWGDPTLSFEWHKVDAGGTIDGAGDNVVVTNAGTDNGAPYHIFTSSYTTATLAAGDNGAKYYCDITNPYGTTRSTICTLTIGLAPVITSGGTLSPISVSDGGTISITGAASGSPTISYTWLISSTPDMSIFDVYSSQYVNTPYTTGAVAGYISHTAALSYAVSGTPNLNGTYLTLYVMSPYGSAKGTSTSVTVTSVGPPPTVVTDPSPVTISAGVAPTTVNFTAVFTGSLLSYQWQYSDTLYPYWYNVVLGVHQDAFYPWAITGSTSVTEDSTTSVLHITNDPGFTTQSTIYRCIATNVSGTATTATALLTVGSPVSMTSVTVSPSSYTFKGPFDNQQFVATAHWSDSSTTNVTNTCAWSTTGSLEVGTYNFMQFGSPNALPGQAFVTATNTPGACTVVATHPNTLAGTASCTNTGSAFSSVTITPLNDTVAVGSTKVYTATAHYADSNTSNVTSFSTWYSGTPAYATIGNSSALLGYTWGYPTASGISNGTTEISCTTGNVIGYGGIATSSPTNLTVTSGGGGGGGGSSTWARPTTGTGATTFGGAIDTTAATVDSGTFTNKVGGTGSVTYAFSGFGTGIYNGILSVRLEGFTWSDDTFYPDASIATSTINLRYTCNLGTGVLLATCTGQFGELSSVTPYSSSLLTGLDLASLTVNLQLVGHKYGTAPDFNTAICDVTVYDVVFIAS